MIEINRISKRFGHLQVLQEVSASFGAGQCVALIGPNGCGKTTLIKTILGLVKPDAGDILFDNASILDRYEYRKEIGYMPQAGRYPDNMRIGQVIDLVKQIRGMEEGLDTDLYDGFEVKGMLDKRMRTLSGGTIQKISAVLAFLFSPRVLILDEPTAGLDPLASELLRQKIQRELENGKLILITSHLLSELDEMATHLLFMQEGVILFHKPVNELQRETGTDRISRAITQVLKNRGAWEKS